MRLLLLLDSGFYLGLDSLIMILMSVALIDGNLCLKIGVFLSMIV